MVSSRCSSFLLPMVSLCMMGLLNVTSCTIIKRSPFQSLVQIFIEDVNDPRAAELRAHSIALLRTVSLVINMMFCQTKGGAHFVLLFRLSLKWIVQKSFNFLLIPFSSCLRGFTHSEQTQKRETVCFPACRPIWHQPAC